MNKARLSPGRCVWEEPAPLAGRWYRAAVKQSDGRPSRLPGVSPERRPSDVRQISDNRRRKQADTLRDRAPHIPDDHVTDASRARYGRVARESRTRYGRVMERYDRLRACDTSQPISGHGVAPSHLPALTASHLSAVRLTSVTVVQRQVTTRCGHTSLWGADVTALTWGADVTSWGCFVTSRHFVSSRLVMSRRVTGLLFLPRQVTSAPVMIGCFSLVTALPSFQRATRRNQVNNTLSTALAGSLFGDT